VRITCADRMAATRMTNTASNAKASDPRLGRTLVLLTVSLCTMLYSLTVTIVNVALPQLQGALSATPDQISWVVTLNILATAIMTPMRRAATKAMKMCLICQRVELFEA